MLNVAVVGASGYAGGEIIRILESHPNVQIKVATANSLVGKPLGELYPELAKTQDLVFQTTSPGHLADQDIVFIALPHTLSAEVVKMIPETALVIDCGADFRLESAVDFRKFYGVEHLGTFVYGMPELIDSSGQKQRQKIQSAKRIAVPGCNATAITLSFAPLLQADLIAPDDLVSNLSVGTSGAGRQAEVNVSGLSSAYAYQVGGVHRHIPEVKQNLNKAANTPVSLTFTPVLVPMFRGILAVNTAKLKDGVALSDIAQAFEGAYGNEPFVELLPPGSFPNTANVEMRNKIQIGFAIDEITGRVIVISALDNLVKGTAGAAIQCMNLALGFEETTGLEV